MKGEGSKLSEELLNTAIRPAVAADRAFVADGWIKSGLRLPWAHGVEGELYLSRWPPIVDALLDDPEIRVLVACDLDDADQCFGFICVDPRIGAVHYVYTKDTFRRMNVATRLITEAVRLQLIPADKICSSALPKGWSRDWPRTLVDSVSYDPTLFFRYLPSRAA